MRLFLDVTDLSDNDLQELQELCQQEEAVEDLTLGYLNTEIEESGSDPSGHFTIHASAAPFILALHFTQQHWKQITGGVSTTVAAVTWLTNRIRAWNERREAQYEFKPLYGPDDNVVSLVKVPRSKAP